MGGAGGRSGTECIVGQERSCDQGGPYGSCAAGTQTCEADGVWGSCSIQPAAADGCEAGNDDDCDGTPNDGCACVAGQIRSCAQSGALGNCAAGEQSCESAGSWGPCSIVPARADDCAAPGDDANCNGTPNEGCSCEDGETQPCGTVPEVGQCHAGESRCTDGAWGACQGVVYPAARDCNSADDNDCDGARDDVLDEQCRCAPAATEACDTHPGLDGVGLCQAGSRTCTVMGDGSLSDWSGCVGSVGPLDEVCDGAADENCDGRVDEGCGGTGGIGGSGTATGATAGGGTGGGGVAGAAAGSGGNGTGGGAGEGGTGGCRTSPECQAIAGYSSVGTCIRPYDSPIPRTNACVPVDMDWCGRCRGLCAEPPPACESDAECPTETPHCTTLVRYFIVTACAECLTDEECPAERPRCVEGVDAPAECRECLETSDCAVGQCLGNTCLPQCEVDADCEDPSFGCTAEQRCEPLACSAPEDCPDASTCSSTGRCERASCDTDADCPTGYCVQSRCYGSLGTCYFEFIPQ